MSSRIRLTHIINSFEFGGAEAMLCNLLLRMDRRRFDISVISLIDDLTVAGPLIKAGIPIQVAGFRPNIPDPRAFARLMRQLGELRPHVVQTWMDHSNLIGGAAARMATRAAVVWGVHHCDHLPGVTKRTTLAAVRAGAILSKRIPSKIVFCSEQARSRYAAFKFHQAIFDVIPNGFDTAVFRPDSAARSAVREELGIDPAAPLVGLVARWDPLKDHGTFLKAAAALARRRPDVRFLLCGHGVDAKNTELAAAIDSLSLSGHCRLLGPRLDMPRIHAALDVLASSSQSEAFPLVIGEAMACAVPCAVTDVGDSALIVGETGKVVPPREPELLADAIDSLLAMNGDARAALGAAARRRVCERFDLNNISRRYEALYESICSASRSGHEGAKRETIARCSPPRPRVRRVLMIVESSAGGTGRHVLDLCEGLLARGCEVHLACSSNRVDDLFRERLSALPALPRLVLPMPTAIHPADPRMVRAIREYARRAGPFDVIHGHSSKGGAYARLAAIGTDSAAFYTLHGLIMMDPGLARAKRLIYLTIERMLASLTRRIIAVSPEEQRAAVQLGFGKTRVLLIPNGVGELKLAPRDAARRTIGSTGSEKVVGFVGRLVSQKAVDVLLRAFATASDAQARLAIVGDGPLRASLQQLAEELRIANRVLWLGERDAREVLAGFDLFAIASRKEGLPYVVLEAMAAGLPIVATASAGVEILVENAVNGCVAPPDDPAALGAALASVLSSPDRMARMGQASRQRAGMFTIDQMVDRTLAAYEEAR